jgi:uncharacterized repeat protein (TIGR03803 family)
MIFLLATFGGNAALGNEVTLHNFSGGSDGAFPGGALIADGSGNFYGTTEEGGGGSCINGYGCGVVFKLGPNGAETILYAFAGGNDGAVPAGGLIMDTAGNFYGTTAAGGGHWMPGLWRLRHGVQTGAGRNGEHPLRFSGRKRWLAATG